jgi:hypothetical protein
VELKDLKQEATELGITFNVNIGKEKLASKIEDYYKAQETAVDPTKGVEDVKVEVPTKVKNSRDEAIRLAEAKARETRVITIIDNDQRVNNQTTVATISCENMYFNLGTRHLPLNLEVEVMQGHIDSLKGIKIPQHVKDVKTGLNRVTMRNRYSISYSEKN